MQQVNKNNKDLFNAVGSVIKRLRQKTGLSVNLFAYEHDLQKSMISRLENGKNEAKLTSLWKIAEALKLKPFELISEIEKELPRDFKFLED